MREPAIQTTTDNLIRATLVIFALFGAFGCGDDEGATDAGPAAGRGGGGGTRSGRGGGSGGAGGAAPIEPLRDKTAGNTCKADKDCGTGMCLTTLPAGFAGQMMEAPGGYCSGQCMTDADCGLGGACSGAFPGIAGIGATLGSCLKSCSDSAECRDGYRCVSGLGMPVMAMDGGAVGGGLLGPNTCQPLPATDKLASGIVGSMCTADGDCGDGRCMTTTNATTYPGGYCTGSCLEDSDCGAQGSCRPALLGGVGTCYLSCASDADCSREGYRCRVNGMLMQCVPGAAPLPDGVAGDPCTGDADCGGAALSCGTRLGNYAAPGGYCTQRCVNSTDCGAGAVCVGGGGGGFGFGGAMAGGTCYKSCAGASDCREGYTCGAAGGTGPVATETVCAVTPPEPDAGI